MSSRRRVAVAAPHPQAVESARSAVASGGNALDAALAAAVTLTVVYPHQCSLGGDLIALVRREHDEPATLAVVSAGAAPQAIDVARLSREPSMPRQGPQSVTIPGVVEGWRELSDLGAQRPLRESFDRARVLAIEGTAVTPGLVRGLRERRPAVFADPGLRSVFTADGEVLDVGDVLVQPALASTFAALIDDSTAIYDGAVAERLVSALQARGGAHTRADFARHRAAVEPALVADVGSSRWYAAPPPAPGAVFLGLLPEALSDGGGAAGLLADCLHAMEIRDRVLGDPRAGPVGGRDVLAPTTEEDPGCGYQPPGPSGDTVAVVATDTDGLTVSLIQSVYQLFGSGILEPQTGVVLQNRGSAFSTDPTSPARVLAGARPPHTLCPVIAESGEGVLALGCQGGRAQPWILAQVARDLGNRDIDPGSVIARPRWVIGGRDLGHEFTAFVAEPALDDVVIAATGLGLTVEVRPAGDEAVGHVQVVRSHRSDTGPLRLDGASDSRADGVWSTFAAPLEP